MKAVAEEVVFVVVKCFQDDCNANVVKNVILFSFLLEDKHLRWAFVDAFS